MKIYVISLPDAVDRRRNVRNQLDRFGLGYAFLDALDGIDGARLFDSVDEYAHLIHTGRRPTPGEIGCYASHLSVWRRCIADRQPVCVLEDDCQLEEFFPASLDTAAQLINAYGFIRLQTESHGQKTLVSEHGRFRLHRYTKMPHSTLAYVVSPEVARRFVECSEVMTEPVDVFIKKFWAHRQPLYGLTPYVARESALSETSHLAGRQRAPKSLATRITRVATRFGWLLRRVAFNISHKENQAR